MSKSYKDRDTSFPICGLWSGGDGRTHFFGGGGGGGGVGMYPTERGSSNLLVSKGAPPL